MVNTYTDGACALKLPSSYVPMTSEEMEYLEGGGNSWLNKRSTVAAAIDVIAIVVTAGKSIATIRAAKAFLRANKNKVVHQVSGKLMQLFGGKVSNVLISAGVQAALTLTEFGSFGGLIAAGIDYADGCYNGYCFG